VSRPFLVKQHRSIRAVVYLSCLDLEGVLVPEIWLCVAEHTGIDALRLTTRDIPDYDQLMQHRISIIDENGLQLAEIRQVIEGMAPLPGAIEFLAWLRQRSQVIVLSDTFYQFAAPLMRQLLWPTLFCNHLTIDDDGQIAGYRLRQVDQKREAVKALHKLNFKIIAAGDSYNDTSMLNEADRGILFRPPDSVAREFSQYPVTHDYEQLRAAFENAELELGNRQPRP
jgi:phosphoserine/homoserine phosphotransferase